MSHHRAVHEPRTGFGEAAGGDVVGSGRAAVLAAVLSNKVSQQTS